MKSAKLFASVLLLTCCVTGWSNNTGRIEQKRQAETDQSELRKKLNELKQDIRETESAKHHVEDELAHSETAISTTNRKLVELTSKRQRVEQRLAELALQEQQLQEQIAQQKSQLAVLLREQYETGSADRMKLLLSGDNPNRVNRDLHYLGYVSQSQNKLIHQLRTNLAAVEQTRLATEQSKHELEEITLEQQQQKSELVKQKATHAEVLKQLSGKLSAQRKEVGQLQKNEQRLASLVQRLNHLIEQQRKADQRKAAQLAAQRKQQQRKTTNNASASKPIQITQTPEQDELSEKSAFAQLKGRLRLPVQGELTAKYGAARGEGTVWKGVFISAEEGATIKSIAPGKVVFADWLRGFGNLIILDHGAQYMSIYGNNQALLKQPGESVSAGDAIATVGNSGGNEQSGLYFELRHQGKAFNPLGWVSLK